MLWVVFYDEREYIDFLCSIIGNLYTKKKHKNEWNLRVVTRQEITKRCSDLKLFMDI